MDRYQYYLDLINAKLAKAFGSSESRTLEPFRVTPMADGSLVQNYNTDNPFTGEDVRRLQDDEDEETGIFVLVDVVGSQVSTSGSRPVALPPVNPELVNSLMRGIR